MSSTARFFQLDQGSAVRLRDRAGLVAIGSGLVALFLWATTGSPYSASGCQINCTDDRYDAGQIRQLVFAGGFAWVAFLAGFLAALAQVRVRRIGGARGAAAAPVFTRGNETASDRMTIFSGVAGFLGFAAILVGDVWDPWEKFGPLAGGALGLAACGAGVAGLFRPKASGAAQRWLSALGIVVGFVCVTFALARLVRFS